MQEYQFPKSRQQRDFENLCKSIMKIMSDLQEEQQNDLHEDALQLWQERNDRTHKTWNERK